MKVFFDNFLANGFDRIFKMFWKREQNKEKKEEKVKRRKCAFIDSEEVELEQSKREEREEEELKNRLPHPVE